MSTYAQASTGSDNDRSKNGDSAKKDMWSSMLDSVASGKRLPERNILVLGGSSDCQKGFLETLSSDNSAKRIQSRHGSKQPPVAHDFALGYTYHDVLDADHEDILARLSLYLLADPSPSFTPLLRGLLTPETIPHTLIVILLDWSQPWLWLRQLRDWIRLLRVLLVSLDQESKLKMEEVMIRWRDRGRTSTTLEGVGSTNSDEGEVSLPLGPGEWEEALGLPLCVVCQNSDQMEILERENSWKEEEFDFVLQYLRTVLLKHGASLIYTIPSVPNQLQTLIHSSLGIQSLVKRQPLKHNVIDRDKVVVPPNWDSWGKIRVLREGFNVEGVSQAWSLDIDDSVDWGNPQMNGLSTPKEENSLAEPQMVSAVAYYEETVKDPRADSPTNPSKELDSVRLEVEHQDPQTFLATQLEILDRIKSTADSNTVDKKREGTSKVLHQSEAQTGDVGNAIVESRVNEHIGPVQFNMGGIQVDADDMLKRLKDRQTQQTTDPETLNVANPENRPQNDALASFFAGLMKRGGGSATSSPRPGAS